MDTPLSIPDNDSVWMPHNYDFTFWGPIPVRRAVELYLNEMQLEDPRSTIIAQRVLSRLEEKTEIDQE